MSVSDQEIAKLFEAQAETESRMEYWSVDTVCGDESGKRTQALLSRLERTHARRDRQIVDTAARAISGLSMVEFCRRHRQGIRNGYTPSVSKDQHGSQTVAVFSEEFARLFGRPAYVY